MIEDRINPKYGLLNYPAQAMWSLFQFIQDYETHQFNYSLKTIMEITGHFSESINNAKDELEINKIISIIRSHRKANIYTLLEAWTIQKGKTFNYFLCSENEHNGHVKPNTTDTSKRTPSNPDLSDPDLSINSSSIISTGPNVHADIEEEEPDFINEDENHEFFTIARKAIEFNYDRNYFMRKGLMPLKRKMMIEIGKYEEEKIIRAIEYKGMGLKNPEFLIPNVLEELKLNGNGHKPIKGSPDIDPKKAEMKAKAEAIRIQIEACNNNNTFWKLLRDRVNVGDHNVEELWKGYEAERDMFNPDATFDWFMKYCKKDLKPVHIKKDKQIHIKEDFVATHPEA
jgi:hypothetical protein